MTHNQIEYQNYKENVRHNKSVEDENYRHNVAGEVETNRHNVAYETETNRHNVVVESQGWETVRENQRHNIQSERIGMMQASAAQTQAAAAYRNANTNAYTAQKNAEYQSGMLNINKQNANTATMNAYTNRSNADTQAKYTSNMSSQGWINSMAKMVDSIIPFRNYKLERLFNYKLLWQEEKVLKQYIVQMQERRIMLNQIQEAPEEKKSLAKERRKGFTASLIWTKLLLIMTLVGILSLLIYSMLLHPFLMDIPSGTLLILIMVISTLILIPALVMMLFLV